MQDVKRHLQLGCCPPAAASTAEPQRISSPGHVTVALAGNPNAGKSTIFNAITGLRQHVGNYPGVTVEKKEGERDYEGARLHVVDLPGTYSLTAYSVEEVVARSFLIDERCDVVVDVVDSSNLERNLYLATQLLELGVPLVLAFNMSDVAEQRGYRINVKRMSELLGVPIVRTVGNRGRGVEKILAAVTAVARDPAAAVARQAIVRYGHEVEEHVQQLTRALEACPAPLPVSARWFAVKLLEDDERAIERLRKACPEHVEPLLADAARLRKHIGSVCGDSPEIILADRRYGFISGACTEAVHQTVEQRHEQSDRIDRVLLNRYLGLPIFAILMYLVFQFTFLLGNPMVDLLDQGKGWLAEFVRGIAPGTGIGGLLTSLLADGIIEGVGSVLTFVPLILLLYLAIAILEDTGYMARGAFVLDRFMHRIGLHGKSFIPLVIGFGCTVPAIMSTRILESRRDRLTTMLVLPLMSCGARLPVYVLIIGAFFRPEATVHLGPLQVSHQGLMLFAIYFIGILLAAVSVRILRATVLRGETAPFVMELPPYRAPAVKGLALHTWERTWHYVKKAGTVILAICIVLWVLATFPQLGAEREQVTLAHADAHGLDPAVAVHQAQLNHSAIGRIGHAVAPVLRPCGFDWKISTALLGSFAAKEAFISQMGIIHAVDAESDRGTETLQATLSDQYTPLVGFCIMLFILISSPCLATVAVTYRESGHWKWALLQWTYLTAVAWVVTAGVYQVGRLFG